MDNSSLAFEDTLEQEFAVLADLEPDAYARWVPTGATSTPIAIVPQALRWTDTSRLCRGLLLLAKFTDQTKAWMWWPHLGTHRWLHGSPAATGADAIAHLTESLRDRPIREVSSADHGALLAEVLAPEGPTKVSVCFPELEAARGS